MKLRDQSPNLDPAIERELEALEAALAGEAVAPEHADLAALATAMGELRAAPGERFAAELDSRAAAGFEGERQVQSRLAGAWQRFRAAPTRRQLMPVAASALGAIVVATALVTSSGDEPGSETPAPLFETSGGSEPAGGTVDDQAAPTAKDALGAPASGDSSAQLRDAGVSAIGGRRAGGDTGPFASGERRRFVERSAQITLGTEPERVRNVTDEVLGVVGRYEGIVLSSSINDGAEGEAGANFELLLPSQSLDDSLGDLSTIAELRSREETTTDITAPTVTVQERLRDARAEIEGLLKQLADADTDEERAAVKAQLAFQRQRVAGLRETRNALERRANLSRVSVVVVTGDADVLGSGEEDQWTLGDALHDAGRVLAVAAGVTLVGLAVLAPIALLALLVWLTRRAWVRQSRERALEG